jgi:flagellar export protein FliJ
MKRFRSRVTALRELRQRREDEALQVHARALRTRKAAEDRLQACLGALFQHHHDVQADLMNGCPASRLAQQDGYRLLLEQRWQESRQQVAEAAAATEASLQALLQTRRDREVVEKFCAKELADHQREQLREDQKNLDEMALRRRVADLSY